MSGADVARRGWTRSIRMKAARYECTTPLAPPPWLLANVSNQLMMAYDW